MKHSMLYTLILLLSLTGCTTKTSFTAPQTSLHPPEINTVDDLVAEANRSFHAIDTLQASGTVTLNQNGERVFSFPFVIKYKKDGKFFLRVYKTLAPNLFTAIENNNQFFIHVPTEGSILTGHNSKLAGNTSYAVSFIPEYLRKAFIPDFIAADHETSMSPSTMGKETTLSTFHRDKNVRIQMRSIDYDSQHFRPNHELYFSENGIHLFEVYRSNYRTVENTTTALPYTISVHDIQNEKTILFHVHTYHVNKPLNTTIFDFYSPKKTDVVRIQ